MYVSTYIVPNVFHHPRYGPADRDAQMLQFRSSFEYLGIWYVSTNSIVQLRLGIRACQIPTYLPRSEATEASRLISIIRSRWGYVWSIDRYMWPSNHGTFKVCICVSSSPKVYRWVRIFLVCTVKWRLLNCWMLSFWTWTLLGAIRYGRDYSRIFTGVASV